MMTMERTETAVSLLAEYLKGLEFLKVVEEKKRNKTAYLQLLYDANDCSERIDKIADILDEMCKEWELSIDEFGDVSPSLAKYPAKELHALVEWLIIKSGK